MLNEKIVLLILIVWFGSVMWRLGDYYGRRALMKEIVDKVTGGKRHADTI